MKVKRDAQGRIIAVYKTAAGAQVSNEEEGLQRLNRIVDEIADTHDRIKELTYESAEDRALEELRRLFPADKEVQNV